MTLSYFEKLSTFWANLNEYSILNTQTKEVTVLGVACTRVVRNVLRLCLYLKVICVLYNKIHTDEQLNVMCGSRVEKRILLEILVSKATNVVLLVAL